MHALHCSIVQRSLPVSVSPNSDQSGKQSMYPKLIICLSAHCLPSVKISCKSVRTFLRKVANRQTDKQRRKHNLLGGGNYYAYINNHICDIWNVNTVQVSSANACKRLLIMIIIIIIIIIHNHRVACLVLDVAVPTNVLQA